MADTDSIHCPSCKTATNLIQRARKPYTTNDGALIYEIGECNNCSQHFLVLRHHPSGGIVRVFPHAIPRSVSDALPEKVKSDFEEALLCESAGAYRAAVTMARRALQSICLDRAAPSKRTVKPKSGQEFEVKNDLSRQIDWLLSEQIITKPLKDMAHEVRSVGNEGAHPEDAEDDTVINEEDSGEILALLEAFAQTLYIAPALLKKRIDEHS